MPSRRILVLAASVYDLMDEPRRARSARDRSRLAVEKFNLTKFCDLIECDNWDVVVNTHFLPAEIIGPRRY